MTYDIAVCKRIKRKEFKYNAHGITIQEYVASPKIELWLKVFAYIMWWYMNPKHEGKHFFMKHSTIRKILEHWGCKCTDRGIEEAFRILKTPEAEGGVDLITLEYADELKSQWIAEGKNPRKWIYRTVYIKWARVRKFLSIFTGESKVVKTLPAKHRLKKLIYKRFMSYTWTLQAMFEKQMKEANIEKYTSAHKMFYGYLFTYSRKYYDPTKLIKNYIPEHTIDIQKEQDREAWSEAYALGMQRAGKSLYSKDTISYGAKDNNSSKANNEVIKNFYQSIK